jgi:predicted GNAT family N-acyltransferase
VAAFENEFVSKTLDGHGSLICCSTWHFRSDFVAGFSIELDTWMALGHIARDIREVVFIQEQRVSRELEWDEFDAVSIHAICWYDSQAVATARLLPTVQGISHLGRVAVLPNYRRRGLASRLLEALIGYAKVRGDQQVVLHAQCDAIPLYEKFNFLAVGDVFLEADIWHQEMVLRLA